MYIHIPSVWTWPDKPAMHKFVFTTSANISNEILKSWMQAACITSQWIHCISHLHRGPRWRCSMAQHNNGIVTGQKFCVYNATNNVINVNCWAWRKQSMPQSKLWGTLQTQYSSICRRWSVIALAHSTMFFVNQYETGLPNQVNGVDLLQ